jgi:hypothetical protein
MENNKFRIFQTIMGMTLVNLAHAFLTDEKLTLREYTNIDSLAMCAKVEEGVEGEMAGGTRGSKVGLRSQLSLWR